MCGRTSLFAPPGDLEDRFDATVPDSYQPRYNIAPTDDIEVITADATDQIQQFYWGLRPHWADVDDTGFINARSETAHEKPAFADAWESRPCLVLSSGFYEWQEPSRGPKQPYRLYREDSEGRSPSGSRPGAGDDIAFAMAGLWERWEPDDSAAAAPLDTVTILTTDPNEVAEPIHDRMPVILTHEDETEWLTAGPEERQDLCQPYPGDDLDAYPISTTVNDPSNDSPAVIEPDDTEQSGLGEFA